VGHEKDMKPRTVSVRGSGSISVAPDQIRVNVQVNVRAESASGAMTTASRRTSEILDLLRSYNVDPKDIQTQRVTVAPVYDYEKRVQPPPIVGYTATNEFAVTFKEAVMSRVGEFLDRAVTAGAASFGGLVYESSKQREQERKALVLAAADAKARAEVLAEELGAKIGRVLSVSEIGPRIPGPIVQDIRAEASVAAPVMTGEITVKTTVDVMFELIEK
jgi:hypothetical protein